MAGRVGRSEMRGIWILVAAVVIAGFGNATAREYGDPARGLTFAQKTCATCHAVRAEDLLSPVSEATSFVEVANTPGMTRIALTAFFQTPHPTMPNLVVAPQDMDDVIAYILTLKPE
jgi:mono/diheme cytochrome c family protein